MTRLGSLSLALLLAACSSSHGSDDDGGPRGRADAEGDDITFVVIMARLPGARVSAGGEAATLDEGRAVLEITPRLVEPSLPLTIEAEGMTVEGVADWSRDLGSLSAGTDPTLASLELAVVLLPDGSCGVEVRGGRTADPNREAWGSMGLHPIAPCGPFGLLSFRVDRHEGPCMDGSDCTGFDELSGDGRLRIDRIGEPGVVHEAVISEEDLATARLVLTDPSLLRLVGRDELPCPQPVDLQESMRVAFALERLTNDTALCDDYTLVAVRELFDELEAAYFP